MQTVDTRREPDIDTPERLHYRTQRAGMPRYVPPSQPSPPAPTATAPAVTPSIAPPRSALAYPVAGQTPDIVNSQWKVNRIIQGLRYAARDARSELSSLPEPGTHTPNANARQELRRRELEHTAENALYLASDLRRTFDAYWHASEGIRFWNRVADRTAAALKDAPYTNTSMMSRKTQIENRAKYIANLYSGDAFEVRDRTVGRVMSGILWDAIVAEGADPLTVKPRSYYAGSDHEGYPVGFGVPIRTVHDPGIADVALKPLEDVLCEINTSFVKVYDKYPEPQTVDLAAIAADETVPVEPFYVD